MENFHLQKTAQIISVDADIKLAEYERFLNQEGLTGGYRPVEGNQVTLRHCLSERVSNMYFFKYGGIEDLCIGGRLVNRAGTLFNIPVYPRAATGPDLRRAIIGSQGMLGEFHEVSLRVFPMPEMMIWGLALLPAVRMGLDVVRMMRGNFIDPLFVRVMNEDESAGIVRSLNLAEGCSFILAFKLSGFGAMVEASREAIIQWSSEQAISLLWPSRPAEIEILDQTIINPESFLDMVSYLAPLSGRSLTSAPTVAEKNFIKKFKEKSC